MHITIVTVEFNRDFGDIMHQVIPKMERKILILSTINDGGINTYLHQMSKLDRENGGAFSISLAAFKKPQSATIPNFTSEFYFSTSKGVIGDKKVGILILGKIFREALWLRRIILYSNPDIIISVDTHSNFIACIIKKLFFPKIKLIITNHNNVEEVLREKLPLLIRVLVRIVGHFILGEADSTVCISKSLGKSYKSFFNLKQSVKTIEYGINLAEAKKRGNMSLDIKSKKYFSDHKKTVVAVGRLVPQKNFDVLIKAIKLVTKDIKKVQLIIVGDGEDKNLLKKLVGSLGLESSVHFIGWSNNVYPYFKNADLAVLPSRFEGFGYVLIEAMSQETPVISTDSQYGPSEILDNGTYGILVPIGDISKLKKAIIKVLNNKSEKNKYSKLSQRRILYYSEKRMLSKYSKLICSLE